jgi:hypothetical protein
LDSKISNQNLGGDGGHLVENGVILI